MPEPGADLALAVLASTAPYMYTARRFIAPPA